MNHSLVNSGRFAGDGTVGESGEERSTGVDVVDDRPLGSQSWRSQIEHGRRRPDDVVVIADEEVGRHRNDQRPHRSRSRCVRPARRERHANGHP